MQSNAPPMTPTLLAIASIALWALAGSPPASGFGGGCMTCGELIEVDQLVVAVPPPRPKLLSGLRAKKCCPAPVNVVNDCRGGGCKLRRCGATGCGELLAAAPCDCGSFCGKLPGASDCGPHRGPRLPAPSSFYGYFRSQNAYADVWAGYADETRMRHRNTDAHVHGRCDCHCSDCRGAELLDRAAPCDCP